MILFKNAVQLSGHISGLKTKNTKIGFVPTMGALHEGHLSLLKASHSANDVTVCSIFINPSQFNDPADFKKYPVTIENDLTLLNKSGTQILFLPEVSEMYPNGASQTRYALGNLENTLEGKYRPGHFQGVCQAMRRLLEIIQPHNLYMGQKDYQQCMIVKRLLEILHSDCILHACPTFREADGLAMSSRNMRLNQVERKKATAIYEALHFLKNNLKPGSVETLVRNSREILDQNQLKADYVEIADAVTLQNVSDWDGRQKIVALIAAFVNEVRLIDNMKLNRNQ